MAAKSYACPVKNLRRADLTRRWTIRLAAARRLPIPTREVFVWVYVVALAVLAAPAGPCHARRRAARRAAPALVGRRARVPVRRDLRRPRPLPPQRALVLARRPAVRLRPRVRHRRRVRARRAHRHRHRLGPDPPPRGRQARLQPRPARARRHARRRHAPPRRRRRRRAAAGDLGRPVRRDARQRRAHDPAARRRDRDRRGQPQAADARPDVRHRRAGDPDQRAASRSPPRSSSPPTRAPSRCC